MSEHLKITIYNCAVRTVWRLSFVFGAMLYDHYPPR